jgi:hypothetical protein
LAIESLVPAKGNLSTLSAMGIDPAKRPKTLILTHADIIKKVVNGSVLSKDDLDPGIVKCLNARDACRGWELNVARISKARTGTFFADFINFKRRTETTGWRFNALLLMVNDVEVNTNPLGPFQDMGQAVFTI